MTSELITTAVWDVLFQEAKQARRPAHVAVAYFGSGASRLLPLPKNSLLVVDASDAAVKSGQTCPFDLLKLHSRGIRVHSHRNLHAKVYVLGNVAFIGSPNVSQHSANIMLEAMFRTQQRSAVTAARKFVDSLCITELDSNEITRLARIYKPPRFSAAPLLPQSRGATLVMELTQEQGPGRNTQVQPPKGVWVEYFGLDTKSPPPSKSLTLRNGKDPSAIRKRRPIVSHHHVWTLEIGDAGPPRPAILMLKRDSASSYTYYVYRPADPQFKKLRHLLDITRNPHYRSGRRWIVI